MEIRVSQMHRLMVSQVLHLRHRRPIYFMLKIMREGLNLAGVRFWTASLLPACVGITLPIWLRPANFTFKLSTAIEFLLATVLLHAGFAFLWAWFENRSTKNWSQRSILLSAVTGIGLACLLGIHLNSNLQLHVNVYRGIFLIYGICVLFIGALYVVPPLNFYRRMGGEIVLAYSLGLLPLLGAYLVQVGDLTRTVYLAALPVVAITGLWVWLYEVTIYAAGGKSERQTLVTYLGIKCSGRVVVLSIAIIYLFTLLLAVFSASLSPLALAASLLLLSLGKIVIQTWHRYAILAHMQSVRNLAAFLHGVTCCVLALSSLFVGISGPFPIISW